MKSIPFIHTVQAKIILIYMLLIIMAMQIIGIYFVKTMENSFVNNFKDSLYNRVDLLEQYVRQSVINQQTTDTGGATPSDNLTEVVDNFNKISGAEIQVIDVNSVVISASNDFSLIGKKKTQIEITQALQGFATESKVLDQGVRKLMIVTPVKDYDTIVGVVYVLASMEEIYKNIDNITKIFIVGISFALALTVLLGIILARTITNPIKDMTKKIVRIAEGRLDQKVSVVGEDEISQLGLAYNDMLEKLSEALSQNEEEKDKLSSILSNMSDGVIATDERGRVIVINRRAAQMLRRENEDLIGQDISKLVDMDNKQINQRMKENASDTIVSFDQGKEASLLVRLTLTPIRRKGKEIMGAIIVIQDVTEQERLDALRREFVANVSHELRTPLTSVKSYVEALEDGAIEDEQLRNRFMGVIRNETERMIRLVSDLLQLSRLDSSREVLNMKPHLIAEMLEDVADRFSFQLQQRKIAIRVEVDENLQMNPVRIDADKLDQVLDNLLSNAIKFTPEYGQIIIFAQKINAQFAEISVSDTGIGIPDQELPRIFERFFRVEKARSRNMGGTGLGLSISQEIVRAHGGQIQIESKLNQGTKVSFTLPFDQREGGALH
ncbi:MAG: sensor histidine kinase YycG [Bacillota bacterium]|jgi:two-component system sensor histidine kinase VicK